MSLTALILSLAPLALSSHTSRAEDGAATRPVYVEHGEASWYGPGCAGKKTASGERFDPEKVTAAHPDLPLGAKVTVTNLENGKRIEVKITDRGPNVDGRAIDLSKGAARKLDMTRDGTAPVRIEATAEQIAAAAATPPARKTAAAAETRHETPADERVLTATADETPARQHHRIDG